MISKNRVRPGSYDPVTDPDPHYSEKSDLVPHTNTLDPQH